MKYVYILLFLFVLLPARTIAIRPHNALFQHPIAKSTDTAPPTVKAPQKAESSQKTLIQTSSIREYVVEQANIYGVDPIKALWIVSHESQMGQNLEGDDGQSLGYWMISTVYHPEVGRACSLNLQCSTSWSLNWIKKGNINQWSTWKYRCKWYIKENPPECQ